MEEKSILNEIAEKTRARIAEEKKKVPMETLKEKIEEKKKERAGRNIPTFYENLKEAGMSYICEVKKASPSKGLISSDFPYLAIAEEYEAAGASAISCLTEPYYFQGADDYLEKITGKVNIPVLRKDFTIDPYMIY